MRYENYVRSEMWSALERGYNDKPCDELEPMALEHYIHTLMPHMLQYDECSIIDVLEARKNVIDNIDDVHDLVIYDYISYYNLGVLIATCQWENIDEIFKRRWVDELTTIVVNDYIQYRKEM